MSPNRALDPRPQVVRSPKRGGGVRWLARLDRSTDARYAALVASVAPAIEARLGAEVVANRAVLGTPRSGLSLRPWRPAWDAFLLLGRRLSLAAEAFVSVDVRRCYPSIGPDLVRQSLRRLGCAMDDVRGVTAMLEALAATGVRGLPIGPDASAVLANAVLAGADEALRAAGVRHLRWVDDVWIFPPGRLKAVAALGAIERWLEGHGLSLAPEKTVMLGQPHEIAAVIAGGNVSLASPRYHRRSDAHALPGVHGAHPLVPAERGVGPDRRTPRAASGIR